MDAGFSSTLKDTWNYFLATADKPAGNQEVKALSKELTINENIMDDFLKKIGLHHPLI